MNLIIYFFAFFFSNFIFSSNNRYPKYRKIFLDKNPYGEKKNPIFYIDNNQKNQIPSDQKIIRVQTPIKTHRINQYPIQKRDLSSDNLKIERVKIKIFENKNNPTNAKNFLNLQEKIKIERQTPENNFFLNYEKKELPLRKNLTDSNNEDFKKMRELVEKKDVAVQANEIKKEQELNFSDDEREDKFHLTESIRITAFDAQKGVDLYNLQNEKLSSEKNKKSNLKVYEFKANFKKK